MAELYPIDTTNKQFSLRCRSCMILCGNADEYQLFEFLVVENG